MGRQKKNYVEFIYCACGCGFTRPKIDDHYRKCYFIRYHNSKSYSGKKHQYWKGGKRKNNYGYVDIWVGNHPYRNCLGYVKEHRLVVEDYYTKKWGIKFILHPSLVVHHINRIRDDNRLENLEILTDSEHKRHHWDLRREIIKKKKLEANASVK